MAAALSLQRSYLYGREDPTRDRRVRYEAKNPRTLQRAFVELKIDKGASKMMKMRGIRIGKQSKRFSISLGMNPSSSMRLWFPGQLFPNVTRSFNSPLPK